MTPEPRRSPVAHRTEDKPGDQRPRDFAEVADAGDKLALCHALNHTDPHCAGRHEVGVG